jgi:hypothetical protein
MAAAGSEECGESEEDGSYAPGVAKVSPDIAPSGFGGSQELGIKKENGGGGGGTTPGR